MLIQKTFKTHSAEIVLIRLSKRLLNKFRKTHSIKYMFYYENVHHIFMFLFFQKL